MRYAVRALKANNKASFPLQSFWAIKCGDISNSKRTKIRLCDIHEYFFVASAKVVNGNKEAQRYSVPRGSWMATRWTSRPFSALFRRYFYTCANSTFPLKNRFYLLVFSLIYKNFFLKSHIRSNLNVAVYRPNVIRIENRNRILEGVYFKGYGSFVYCFRKSNLGITRFRSTYIKVLATTRVGGDLWRSVHRG